MFRRPFTAVALFGISLVMCGIAGAEEWSNWRGPRGDGSSLEKGVPLKWSATENVAWKLALPFRGHSSPIVIGDRMYLVGVDDPDANPKRPVAGNRKRVLVAIDRKSGKIEWQKTVLDYPLEKMHKLNSRASSTPAADEKRVYASFLEGKQMLIVAYDHAGKELWRSNPGVFTSVHGYSSSPVLYKNMVIVNGDHDGNAYLVALNRETGKTVWKTTRENKTRSYCTPIIREIGGRQQMMLSGSKSVASYDPNDGSRHWIIDGPTQQFVASLVYNKGLLFVTGGFPDKHILAIDPRGKGNVTESHIKWRHQRNGVSYVPSPVASGDYFFLVSDNGIGTCYDSLTGKVQWQQRMGRHYSGSLAATGEHVYYQDDDGKTKVIKVGPKFEVVAENSIDEPVYSSMAISNGQIFIRGEKHLFCIGKPSNSVSSR